MHNKVSAKIIVVFASVLLLAHAVIPHLHLNSGISIELSHAKTHHHHNPADPNDQCDNNADNCILKQVFLARTVNLTPEFTELLTLYQPDTIQAIISFYAFQFIATQVFSPPGKEKPLLYSYLYCGSISTRGSPKV